MMLQPTTDIQSIHSPPPAISSKDIRRQYRAYDISQMRHIVYVRQSAGDEDIALPGLGRTLPDFRPFIWKADVFSCLELTRREQRELLIIQHNKGMNQVMNQVMTQC